MLLCIAASCFLEYLFPPLCLFGIQTSQKYWGVTHKVMLKNIYLLQGQVFRSGYSKTTCQLELTCSRTRSPMYSAVLWYLIPLCVMLVPLSPNSRGCLWSETLVHAVECMHAVR